MSRRSWILLLGAIAAATVTVSVMAAAGPPWPDLFADCSDEGIQGGPERPEAIDDWQRWWAVLYGVGGVISIGLLVAWAREVRLRRPTARSAAIAVAAIVAAIVLFAVLVGEDWEIYVFGAPLLLAFAWAIAVGFPDYTPVLAPFYCAMTILLARLAASRSGERGQRRVQKLLVVVLLSAWIALAWAGFPSESALSC